MSEVTNELVGKGKRLGLGAGALLTAALAVSVFFSVRTVLDWQAIQLWRIEWLLASIAAFVAGLLLKK